MEMASVFSCVVRKEANVVAHYELETYAHSKFFITFHLTCTF